MTKRPASVVSYNMSKIRSKNTGLETLMQRLLDRAGLKYARHYEIDGRPDFAFPGKRVAVFCDSQFWHGYRWKQAKNQLRTNRAFWLRKIEGNMTRDIKVNSELAAKGWKVLRFWEHEIKDSPDECLASVIQALSEKDQPCP